MPFLKRFAQANVGLFVLGTGFVAYQYPELREEPKQLVSAMRRGMRCVTTGTMMAYDYMSCKEITSETHTKAAERMFKMFCANGGPYIKLGQMFG